MLDSNRQKLAEAAVLFVPSTTAGACDAGEFVLGELSRIKLTAPAAEGSVLYAECLSPFYGRPTARCEGGSLWYLGGCGEVPPGVFQDSKIVGLLLTPR